VVARFLSEEGCLSKESIDVGYLDAGSMDVVKFLFVDVHVGIDFESQVSDCPLAQGHCQGYGFIAEIEVLVVLKLLLLTIKDLSCRDSLEFDGVEQVVEEKGFVLVMEHPLPFGEEADVA
jgi:hypothetical protein